MNTSPPCRLEPDTRETVRLGGVGGWQCGVACTEIDLLEGNNRALRATAHTYGDGAGRGAAGLGSGLNAFTQYEYGRGGSSIDTAYPFRMHSYFATRNDGFLHRIDVTLQQDQKAPLRFSVNDPSYLAGLTDALAAGMTPTMS